MPFESNTETGRISVMKGSRRVLVKVVLFQLRGHGHPQDDTMPNFFANSERPTLGLSNEVSFVSNILWKGGENKGNVFNTYLRGKTFPLFQPPFKRIFGLNDTSFESPYIWRLESAKKLGVASSWGWPRPLNWKSTTFTRTRLEPFMTEILPVSKLLSNGRL